MFLQYFLSCLNQRKFLQLFNFSCVCLPLFHGSPFHSQQMLIFLPYPGIPSLPKRIEIKISSSVSFDLMLVLLKITPNTQEPCRLRNLFGLYCFHQRKWLPLFNFFPVSKFCAETFKLNDLLLSLS